MTKILPKQVLDAYNTLGLKFTTTFYYKDSSCCPLMALFLMDRPQKLDSLEGAGYIGDLNRWAEEKYGRDYQLGFVNRIDKDNCLIGPPKNLSAEARAEYNLGWADASSILEFLKGKLCPQKNMLTP